ncbi:hypothetical protein CR513_35767, partial [Mucuna pruriens]
MVTMFIDTLRSPYYDRRWRELAAQVQPPITERENGHYVYRHPSFPVLRQGGRECGFQLCRPCSGRRENRGRHSIRKVCPNQQPLEDEIKKEEGRDQRCANRTHLPLDQDKHILVPHSYGILASSNTTNTIHSTKPTASRHGGYHQRQANIASREKVTQVPLKPLEPPYQGVMILMLAIGHATERCWSLKHKVQDLLDNRLHGFEDIGPNMHSNPLSAHGTTIVNTISHMDKRVASPNSANRVEEGSHPYPSNNITIVAYIKGNANPRPKPLIIQYNSAPRLAPLIIQVATKPIYNNNAVPWRYPMEEPRAPQIKEETTTLKITNKAETEGMTWNRRIFALEALRNKEPAPAKKEKQ